MDTQDVMTDRELLELAAKAARLSVWRVVDADKENDSALRVLIHAPAIGVYEWNPLTHDGDALTLAVKLHLRIKPSNMGTAVDFAEPIGGCVGVIELLGGDEMDCYAATRRAITRAAAEIGKTL